MILLNFFSAISGMFLGGLLITLIMTAYSYNKVLLKGFWQHIVSRGNNKLSLGKFLLFLLLSSIGLWFITWITLGIIFEKNYTTHEEYSYFALGTPIIFLALSTLLYSIFYKNVSPKYPVFLLMTIFISCVLFITSIISVFRNQELLDWGKSYTPFILVWIFFGSFILLTTLFFIYFDSMRNSKLFLGLNRAIIISMLLLGCSSLMCAWDIQFNSSAQISIMNLDHKLKSTNTRTINEGLEETYALLLNEYGFERIQETMEGRLPNWDSKKYLFVHMYNAISKQSKEDNGLAQGIYGDYYMSYNNGNPSDHIKKTAYEWWNKGALNNDARSQIRLGDCYSWIIKIPDLPKNMTLADSLWREAAAQGCEMANERLNN